MSLHAVAVASYSGVFRHSGKVRLWAGSVSVAEKLFFFFFFHKKRLLDASGCGKYRVFSADLDFGNAFPVLEGKNWLL